MSHLEKFTDENLEKIEDLFIFRPCSLVTQRQQLASIAKSIYTKLVFLRDEISLFLNPLLNKVYFTISMLDCFLTARKHLVMFLKTYKIVHMTLSLCDDYMWRKEVCKNLFTKLRNVFNLIRLISGGYHLIIPSR